MPELRLPAAAMTERAIPFRIVKVTMLRALGVSPPRRDGGLGVPIDASATFELAGDAVRIAGRAQPTIGLKFCHAGGSIVFQLTDDDWRDLRAAGDGALSDAWEVVRAERAKEDASGVARLHFGQRQTPGPEDAA